MGNNRNGRNNIGNVKNDNKNNIKAEKNKQEKSKNNDDINGKAINEKKKSKVKIVLKVIIVVLLIFIISGAGYLIYRTNKNGGGMQGFLSVMVGHDENTLKNMPAISFVVMGESLNLTDTIMVATYNPKTQAASLLSIPRDTFIGKSQEKATAWDKINSLYQGKYPEKTLEAINNLLGTDIEYYVMVDTKALRELVDAIGGVEFDVPIDMKYDDVTQDLHINLKAGLQVLDGEKAEQVVRFRHNNNGTSYPDEYGDNDIGRMRTQRAFITAVLKQTIKLQNIFKIGEFLDIAEENVTTNMDLSVVKDYVPYVVNFNSENLQTGTLPGESKKCNGVWLYVQDKKKTKEIVEELITNIAEPVESVEQTEQEGNLDNTVDNTITQTGTSVTNSENANIKIEVLNGSGIISNLEEVVDKLKQKGYSVTKTGTTNTTTKTSIINRTEQKSTITNQIRKVLGVGATSKKASNNDVDYTIIIGEDY